MRWVFMRSCSGIKKCCLTVLAVVLVFTAFIATGCDTANSGQVKEVSSLDLQLQLVRADKSIGILLIPRSDDGFLVKTDGSIDAKLWVQIGNGDEAEVTDHLVHEWNSIQLTREDYTAFQGASIELVHNQEVTFRDAYGFLDLTLTMPDGKVLTVELADIAISENYNC
jgi:hypothetical protein